MKKLMLSALAFAFLLAFIVTPSKANAAYTPVVQQTITSLQQKQAIVQTLKAPAAAQVVDYTPPISCQYPTSCIAGYFGNGEYEGYWALKIRDCATCIWLRTTRVNGIDWNNDHVAPITCPAEDSCTPAHYFNATTRTGYAMVFGYGTYVRTSRIITG